MTKKQSKMMYGVAILLMLYHHVFGVPEMLGCDYYSVLGWNMGSRTFEQLIAWFGKICVAIYAFISGYGLQKACSERYALPFRAAIKQDYFYCMRHYFLFICKVWLVFFIIMPIGVAFHNLRFDNVWDFILCMFGFKPEKISGQWWYIRNYTAWLYLFPLGNALFRKYCKKEILYKIIVLLILGITAIIMYITKTTRIFVFNVATIAFVEGFLVSRYFIFERLDHILKKHKTEVGIGCLCLTIVIRMLCSTYASYSLIDIILISFFMYGCCRLGEILPNEARAMEWLGKYPLYMWLIHPFFCFTYFQKLVVWSRISTIIYLCTFFLSLGSAILLTVLEGKILKLHRN